MHHPLWKGTNTHFAPLLFVPQFSFFFFFSCFLIYSFKILQRSCEMDSSSVKQLWLIQQPVYKDGAGGYIHTHSLSIETLHSHTSHHLLKRFKWRPVTAAVLLRYCRVYMQKKKMLGKDVCVSRNTGGNTSGRVGRCTPASHCDIRNNCKTFTHTQKNLLLFFIQMNVTPVLICCRSQARWNLRLDKHSTRTHNTEAAPPSR